MKDFNGDSPELKVPEVVQAAVEAVLNMCSELMPPPIVYVVLLKAALQARDLMIADNEAHGYGPHGEGCECAPRSEKDKQFDLLLMSKFEKAG